MSSSKFLIILTALLLCKFLNITSVDWVFIIVFAISLIFCLSPLNYKNLVININTLFEERKELRKRIDDLENKIKKLEKKI
ncbi:hypothetical protein [Aliarcobacter cibarius]|uniref:Uncharacterized protein n=1 Tax=Aliarcobacter cibarius TaxID=255507 RepID=A0ABY2V4R3_9BACT|nr:hypothetical protein [Aliarcobacter cibarius]TLS99924.1 hypothetical protein FE247_05175 [Aliarcobacter cibarius]TLT00333.1 hypothetical protein FE245_05605 [Aliarcobacter cibarius]